MGKTTMGKTAKLKINIEDALAPNKEHLCRVLQASHVENTI